MSGTSRDLTADTELRFDERPAALAPVSRLFRVAAAVPDRRDAPVV